MSGSLATMRIMASAQMEANRRGERKDFKVPGVPGLYLRSSPNAGRQSWIYQYRSPVTHKTRPLTLGQVSEELGLEAAKKKVAEYRKLVAAKVDPATVAKAGVETKQAQEVGGWKFETLLMRFMAAYQPNRAETKRLTAYWLGLKPDGNGGWQERGTGKGVLGSWKGKIFSHFDGEPVLTAVDGQALLDGIKKTASRNRTRSALKTFSGWLSRRGENGKPFVTVDPFAGLRRETQDREEPSRRFLEEWEIAALWQTVAADPDPYGLFALFVLATAQRPEMAAKATYDQIDFAAREWKIKARDVKSEHMGDHVVHLNERALWIIGQLPTTEGRLFQPDSLQVRTLNVHSNAKKKLMAKVDEVAKKAGKPSLEKWTYKRLQPSAINIMEEVLGVPPHVTKAIQQHTQGSKSDRAYRRGLYLKERVEALDAWSRYLAEIVKQK